MRVPVLTVIAVVLAALGADAAAQVRKTPYWASISAGKARMRTGPGRNYPANWLYQRTGLPVKVVDVYKEWRKVEDPGGTQGWMQGNLLSGARTGFVTGSVVAMRDRPDAGGRVLWRAAPGVVGRVSKCASGWCWFDVRGQAGYVETTSLFGVDPDEEVE